MLQDVAALAATQPGPGAIGQADLHVGQSLQERIALCTVGWHGQRRTGHAQTSAHIDGADASAVELGRRLHQQVGQLNERNDLVNRLQHLQGRLGLVDLGAFHAHQHVGLEQWAGTKACLYRRAVGQHHAFVQLAPNGLVGVEALLHRRVGQPGLVAHHLAKALREQAVDLGTGAGAVSV